MGEGAMEAGANADLVLYGGDVYTVDAARSWARAVAVRDGIIVRVGSDDDVRALVGPGTLEIGLEGRMLVPGFQDAHVHASAGGLERIRCDLSAVHTLEAYLDVVRRYAETHPEAPWILGGGWAMDVFPGGVAGRAELDAVVPDRPVFLSNRDHHAAWVNSKALELGGVTSSTPDPGDGRIERDALGEPIGTLQEGAMDLVDRIVPRPTLEEQRRGILEAQRYLHSLGITGWQEAIVGSYAVVPDCFDAYVALAAAGELTARVIGALWFERGRGEEQIDGLLERRARAADGRFRATSVKIMQDGVAENHTAAMLAPYLDGHGHGTGNTGLSYFPPEVLNRSIVRLDAEGFQVHVHAIGDRAVRESLDAIEAARTANGWSDHRHHISHLQFVHPDDVPRFRHLGVVANVQALWACNDPQVLELTVPFVEPDAVRSMYPIGSLVRSGAALAMGSDWPVSSPDALAEMHVAVNRRMPPGYLYGEPDADDPPLLPEQAVDLPTALAGFTIGSAFVNHLDRDTGSIEVGKRADLAVLSENLFAVGVDRIGQARVDMTIVDGAVVSERSA
jgi:predicted amidohydrolase YtcJ